MTGCNTLLYEPFNGTTINSSVWLNEQGIFTTTRGSNVTTCIAPAEDTVSGGFLHQGAAYTPDASCVLPDGGIQHADWSVGYMQTNANFSPPFTIEFRAQFQAVGPSIGTHPAVWMLGYACNFGPPGGVWNSVNVSDSVTCGWDTPPGEELDITELGFDTNLGQTWRNNVISSLGTVIWTNFTQPFDWTAGQHVGDVVLTNSDAKFYADGTLTKDIALTGGQLREAMFLQIGGTFDSSNNPPDAASWASPSFTTVDYVCITSP